MKKLLVVPALLGAVGVSSIFGASHFAQAASFTLNDIKSKALVEVNGTITDIEYEAKGSKSYYEVEILTLDAEYDLKYDATTGTLLSKKKETLKSGKQAIVLPDNALSLDTIQQKALATYGGKITDIEFERKNATFVYEVKLETTNKKYELKYDALTGKLLSEKSKTFTPSPTFLTKDEIKAVALSNIANGTIVDVDFKNKKSNSYYEVDVLTPTAYFSLKLNAVTGQVMSQKQSNLPQPIISVEQAQQAALNVYSGTVMETSFEMKKSASYYEVEILVGSKKREVKVNAVTGSIISKK